MGRPNAVRLLVLAIHPAPYRDPALRILLSNRRLDIRVFYYDRLDEGHTEWDYTDTASLSIRQYLPHARRLRRLRWLICSLSAIQRSHVVIIPGYSRPLSLAALLTCLVWRVPYILTLDTTGDGRLRRLGYLVRAPIFEASKGFWAAGTATRQYLQSRWHVKATMIAEGAYCLDGDAIATRIDKESERAQLLRGDLGIEGDPTIFLSVGKLRPSRRFPLLVSEFVLAALSGPPMHLIIIGDGDDEQEISSLVEAANGRITHLSGVRYADLARYYALAHCYVHAGCEPYSTAVEYAAASGLPIIARTRVGYTLDLVRLGGQAIGFADGARALRARLIDAAQNREAMSDIGQRNHQASARRNPAWAAGELASLVFRIVREGRVAGER